MYRLSLYGYVSVSVGLVSVSFGLVSVSVGLPSLCTSRCFRESGATRATQVELVQVVRAAEKEELRQHLDSLMAELIVCDRDRLARLTRLVALIEECFEDFGHIGVV